MPVSILLEEAGFDPAAKWVIAEGADAIAMNMSLPLEKILDDCILAIYQNGERVRPENGYPLRLIVPGWEGVLNVKWLRRLEVTNRPAMTRNETSRYTELLPDGKARQFTFVMDAKSLITTPTHGMTLPTRSADWPGAVVAVLPGLKSPPMAARAGPRRRCRNRCCRVALRDFAWDGTGTAVRQS